MNNRRLFGCWIMVTLLSAQLAAQSQPIRLSIPAFGEDAEIEIRDLSREAAEAAAKAALEEIYAVEQLLDPSGSLPGGLGQLNGMAGLGPQILAPRTADALNRGLQFCAWSAGAYGPLAGELRQLWRESGEDSVPDAGDLRTAVIRSDCPRLKLSEVNGRVEATLIDGSRIDLGAMAKGYAIDQAFKVLEDHRVANAWIEIGHLWRCKGGGIDGKGWLATLPSVPGGESSDPLDQLWLDNHALAVVPAGFDNEEAMPLIDQRTGVPPTGVIAVVAVTELAVDAAGLGEALFILGLREGQMRLGALKPRPSAYWLLGDGTGQPLESSFRWSELRRVRRR